MEFLTEVSGLPVQDEPAASWIFDRIEEWAKRFPDRFAFALDDQANIREFRYVDVLNEANGIAAGLAARGVQPGDRIGILMENIPQWVFIFLGAMRFGAITVPLATTLPEAHLANILNHSRCRLIFADEPNLETACNIAPRVNAEVVALSDLSAFQIHNPQSTIRNPTNGDATALLIYTSGTTGDPKGVELTLRNLAYEIRGIVEPLAISPDHRILSVLPFSHVLPLVANALGPLCLGAGVVFLSSVSPQRIVEAFKRHRITLFVCVPQFFYMLHKRIYSQVEAQPWLSRQLFNRLRRLAQRTKSAELRRKLFSRIHKTIGPDLRMFASGGSRFDLRIARDLTDLGYTMLNAYGLTETSAAVTATPVRENRLGTVGKPIRGVTIRIDSHNEEGIGEVWIRGPLLMKGYYRDDAHTAEAIRDGWLHTGDLGFIDLEGNLTITGRSKDVIVLANGKNIYPEEIEVHYGRSPFVKEICVIADAEDKLHAIVVPDMDEFRRRGQSGIMEMVKFDIESLSRDLASYQRVLSISIRNEPFPRTVTRKLKRFEIEAEEKNRRKEEADRPVAEDHQRFKSGTGAMVAALIRKAKKSIGGIDPSMNIELDLGFDSLARVELLTEIESQTGVHLDEEEANRIYTLGELLDVIESRSGEAVTAGRGWKELLAVESSEEWNNHYIFQSRPFRTAFIILLLRTLKYLGLPLFHLKWRGIENIPKSGPFMICPNHESYLDAPMLFSVLPANVIANSFSLGYSDYWRGPISRRIAESCNIVAIDPNANLVRAMQAGAVGLKRNKVLVIFPEGTRSIDGHLGEFKKGAAILSSEMKVPIVPVGINGTYESWPRRGALKLHPIEIVFGRPIDPWQFATVADPYAALTESLKKSVKTLTQDTKL
jgi:long-chain acyl-CoA synthetase